MKQLVELALDVENELEAPQGKLYLVDESRSFVADIEFALDKSGKIYLLQARPITTGTKKYSFLKEWKAPGPGTSPRELSKLLLMRLVYRCVDQRKCTS